MVVMGRAALACLPPPPVAPPWRCSLYGPTWARDVPIRSQECADPPGCYTETECLVPSRPKTEPCPG